MSTKSLFGIAAVVIIAFLLLLSNPFVQVPAGHRGVLLEWGAVQPQVLDEGLNFITPVAEKAVMISVQTSKLTVEAASSSKDLQTVGAKITLNYHIAPTEVAALYKEVGIDYEAKIVAPALQEAFKAATAQYTAQELIEKRSLVKEGIKSGLLEPLQRNHMVLNDVLIESFDFSKAFEQAVESKQVAQQKAQQAENDLVRIKTEAEQQIATAMAQAEAIRIQAEAIRSQGGREYVNLKAIEKWNGELPATFVPGSALPFIKIE